MKKNKQKKPNTGIGILFLLGVILIILISFAAKAFDIYNKSSFDGKNNFIISHLGSGGWEAVSLSPSDNSITIVNIKTSQESKFKSLFIPADLHSKNQGDITAENVKNLLNPIMTSSGINIFDTFKINLFLNSVNSSSIEEENINPDDDRVYQHVSEILSNETFLNEKLTIELVNSTGENGIGSNLARYITNLGGNVILVHTGSSIEPASYIYAQKEDSETVKKIRKLLGVKTSTASLPNLSDVKIVIGKDLSERFK